MRKPKFADLDVVYKDHISDYFWRHTHNHLVKYKDWDRIHIQACEVYDRYFGWEEPLNPKSRVGLFIKACVTAGYVKAKQEMENV